MHVLDSAILISYSCNCTVACKPKIVLYTYDQCVKVISDKCSDACRHQYASNIRSTGLVLRTMPCNSYALCLGYQYDSN